MRLSFLRRLVAPSLPPVGNRSTPLKAVRGAQKAQGARVINGVTAAWASLGLLAVLMTAGLQAGAQTAPTPTPAPTATGSPTPTGTATVSPSPSPSPSPSATPLYQGRWVVQTQMYTGVGQNKWVRAEYEANANGYGGHTVYKPYEKAWLSAGKGLADNSDTFMEWAAPDGLASSTSNDAGSGGTFSSIGSVKATAVWVPKYAE